MKGIEYKGKLYAKINGKYIQCTESVEQLERRIKELENNTTELIHRSGDLTHDYWYYCQECLENFEMDNNYNYCPNCGRKIIR